MLTRIYIDNYRGFSSFEWKPGKLVLIGGKNGSGKSSFFSALHNIRDIQFDIAVEECFVEADLTRWDKRRQQIFELDATIGGTPYRYRLVINHGEEPDKARIQQEVLQLERSPHKLFEFGEGEAQLYEPDGTPGPRFPADGSRSALAAIPERRDNEMLTAFARHVRDEWCLLAPLPPRFNTEARGEDPFPEPGFENFVAWYRRVSGDSIRLGQLNRTLSQVLDGFVGLRLEDSGRKAKVLQAVFANRDGSGRPSKSMTYDLDELSDGQRALIALYAILEFGPLENGLLCIDEPDNFVALSEIEPWLRELEDRIERGEGQAFLVSHNPEVINRLWEGHGVLFERDPSGPVRVREMDESSGLPAAEVMARGAE